MNMGNLALGGRSVSLYDILNILKNLYLLVKMALGGRSVSLYDILNILKNLYLLVKKLMEEWRRLNRVMLYSYKRFFQKQVKLKKIFNYMK